MGNYKVGKKIQSVQDFQSHLDNGDDSFYLLNRANKYQRFPKTFWFREGYGTVRNQIKLGMVYEALPAESVDMEPLFEDDEFLSFHTWLMTSANPGDYIQIYENDECLGGIAVSKDPNLYEDILSKNILAKTVRDIAYGWGVQLTYDDEAHQCVRVDLMEVE